MLDIVDNWLADTGPSIMLLSGDAGTGKTTFCSWLLEMREHWSAHYFCSHRISSGSTNPRDFANSLHRQLSKTAIRFNQHLLKDKSVDISSAVEVGTSSGSVSGINIDLLLISTSSPVDLFDTAVREPLMSSLTADNGQSFRFIIDGVDEAIFHPSPNILDLLERFPADPRIKLLVTCRNDRSTIERLFDIFPSIYHVDLSVGNNRLAALQDLSEYVRAEGAQLPKGVVDAVIRRAGSNFLHARALLYSYELSERIQSEPLAADTMDALYTRMLKLLARRYGGGDLSRWLEEVLPVLGLLAVAEAPVPRRTLARWAHRTVPWIAQRAHWMSQIIDYDRDADTYALNHSSVTDFLLSSRIDLGYGVEHHVDSLTCHNTIVDSYLTLDQSTTAPRIDAYGYAHLPSHVAHVVRHEPDQAGLRCSSLVALITSNHYLADLCASHTEPTQRTAPYGVTLDVLLHRRQFDLYEHVLRFIGNCADPFVRSLLDNRLIELSYHEPKRAERLVRSFLLSPVPSAWRSALRAGAGMGLDMAERVYSWIVKSGSPVVRHAAPYELYLRWATAPPSKISDLLNSLARRVSLMHPRRSLRLLKLISNVTITSYVNSCDNVEVLHQISDLWEFILKTKLHAGMLSWRIIEKVAVSPTLASHLARDIYAAAFSIEAHEYSRFFSQSNPDRDAAEHVIEFLNPDRSPRHQISSLRQLLSSDHMIFRALAAQVIAIHSYVDFTGSQDWLHDLYATGTSKSRFWQTMSFGVLLRDSPTEWNSLVNAFTADLESKGQLFGENSDRFLKEYPIHFLPAGLAAGKVGRISPVLEEYFSRYLPAPDLAIEGLGLIGMYYPSQALALLSNAVRNGAVNLDRVALVSKWMHPLHSRLLDAFFEEHGLPGGQGALPTASDYERVTRTLSWIGHFNNGVNEAVRHPKMRVGLLEPVYRHMIHQNSPASFMRAYTADVLTMLRTSDYCMRNWAD